MQDPQCYSGLCAGSRKSKLPKKRQWARSSKWSTALNCGIFCGNIATRNLQWSNDTDAQKGPELQHLKSHKRKLHFSNLNTQWDILYCILLFRYYYMHNSITIRWISDGKLSFCFCHITWTLAFSQTHIKKETVTHLETSPQPCDLCHPLKGEV